MRLIFICLLILNLGLAVWGVFFHEAAAPGLAPTRPVVATKTITTVVPAVANLDAPQQTKNEQDEKEEGLCELVGPFDGDDMADQFVQKLAAIDVESSIEHVSLPAGESYWVHLAPSETVSAAYKILADLQSQGIESYVIGKGELKNAVSLGVFTYQHLAERKLNELKSKGLDPKMKTMERTQIEIWVMVRPAFAEKVSELTWNRLLEGMTLQERRQNFCLPVASSSNFH